MPRGCTTPEILTISKKLLDREIDNTELRLMVYVQYLLINDLNIDPAKVSKDERNILSKWRKANLISGGMHNFTATKKFWDILNELVYLGYVDYEE